MKLSSARRGSPQHPITSAAAIRSFTGTSRAPACVKIAITRAASCFRRAMSPGSSRYVYARMGPSTGLVANSRRSGRSASAESSERVFAAPRPGERAKSAADHCETKRSTSFGPKSPIGSWWKRSGGAVSASMRSGRLVITIRHCGQVSQALRTIAFTLSRRSRSLTSSRPSRSRSASPRSSQRSHCCRRSSRPRSSSTSAGRVRVARIRSSHPRSLGSRAACGSRSSWTRSRRRISTGSSGWSRGEPRCSSRQGTSPGGRGCWMSRAACRR